MTIFERLKFYFKLFLKKMCLELDELFRPETNRKKLEEILSYESTPEISAEIERAINDHANAEPELDPRRTMLFYSRTDESGCNAITAPSFRNRILNALEWAQEHGITVFLADYTTPFGLLALETLVELRESDNSFRVYAVRGMPIAMRKSYRLVPETKIELAFLAARADYDYHVLPAEAIVRIMPNAATQCSEKGLWVAKEKLPPYLMKAWES